MDALLNCYDAGDLPLEKFMDELRSLASPLDKQPRGPSWNTPANCQPASATMLDIQNESPGVRSPSELCGRSVLYSILQFSMARRACTIVTNQCSFRHSSRNLPLKLSMYAFSTGLPGRMNESRTPRAYAPTALATVR